MYCERSTLKRVMGTPAKGKQPNQSVTDQAFNMLPVGQLNSVTLEQTQQRLVTINMVPLFAYGRVVVHRESSSAVRIRKSGGTPGVVQAESGDTAKADQGSSQTSGEAMHGLEALSTAARNDTSLDSRHSGHVDVARYSIAQQAHREL